MKLINIIKSIGEHNDPVYTVVAIAVFKGIFRPIFTMMDKKQDKETKKYAAVREGATEIIAIPTYIALSKLVKKFAPAFATDASISKTLESTKKTFGFVGICFAALVAIPAICNATMPVIMKWFKNHQNCQPQAPEINPTEKNQQPLLINSHPENTYWAMAKVNTGGGMRI